MSSEMEVHQEPAAAPPARVVPPRPKTDDWALVIGPVTNLANQVADTDFVPAALRNKPAAVAAAILFGRELDMPPLQALNQVHVIEGRPSLSAEHMRAMVLAAGHIIRVSGDAGQATAVGRRLLPNGEYDEPVTVTWTLAQARYAGLVTEKKKNWLKYPRAMLKARATAELCRDLFPDITHGLEAVEEAEDADSVPTSTPPPATEKVSRAKKGVTSRPAAGVGTAETPAPAATPKTPDRVTPPEVPLPGEEEPAATPGEGLGNQSTSSPAGPPPLTPERVAAIHDVPEDLLGVRQCPHISNGEQCRYAAGHETRGYGHTYGGGLQDPVSLRHCGEPTGHDPHAWKAGKDTFSCGGADLSPSEDIPDAEVVSEGDGSPDDVAATGDDASYMQTRFQEAQEAAGGPVGEIDPPLSDGKRRLLLAAFNALGVTDRAERLHTSSALLGRQIETWTHLTRSDGDRLIKAVNGLKTREELEELVQRAATEWGTNGTP